MSTYTEMELRVAKAIQDESGPWVNELSAEQSRALASAAIQAVFALVPVVRTPHGYIVHQFVGSPESIWQAFRDAALSGPKAASTISNDPTSNAGREG